MSDWQRQQQQDEAQRQQEAMKALMHAYYLGLPEPECMVLALEVGLANDFYKEIRQ